jgi:hypothetical protein
MMRKRTGNGKVSGIIAASAAAFVLVTVFASSANASCQVSGAKVSGVAWSDGLRGAPAGPRFSVVRAAYDVRDKAPSIVGLWMVAFLSNGQVVDQGFDAWHGDGTETLNDAVPPSTGNVCLGVWEQTGSLTYKLKHLSWNYDANGNTIGVVIIGELITLDRDGKNYHGTTTIDVYDLNKNLLFHDAGEVTGRRITPN